SLPGTLSRSSPLLPQHEIGQFSSKIADFHNLSILRDLADLRNVKLILEPPSLNLSNTLFRKELPGFSVRSSALRNQRRVTMKARPRWKIVSLFQAEAGS